MTDEAVAGLILTHVHRYHSIDLLDVYKLLHQAVFGPGHAVPDRRAAHEWLERESELYTPAANELLVENIHPTGAVVRVHLRPYLAARGDLSKLLEGFIQSAREVTGSLEQMAAWWAIFQRMTEKNGPLANRFSARTVALIGRTRANECWPASHHSPPYDRTYRPAYRVLTLANAEKVLREQRIRFVVT